MPAPLAAAAGKVALKVGKKLLKKYAPKIVMYVLVGCFIIPAFIGQFLFAADPALANGSCGAINGGSYQASGPGGPNQSIISIIYGVGKQRNVSEEVMKAAFVVAYVETTPGPRNAANGNPGYEETLKYPHDFVGTGSAVGRSAGIFQQQINGGSNMDGKPWGTVAQIMDPAHAAGRFFDSAVIAESRGNRTYDRIGDLVQVSAFPGKYTDAKFTTPAFSQLAKVKAEGSPVAAPGANPSAPGATPATNAQGWVLPLAGNPPMTSPFGPRARPVAGGSTNHGGTDWGVPTGTPVMAIGPARVIKAGTAGGYGQAVYLEHNGGVVSEYGHLSSIQVSTGQVVTAGQQIALSGNTGASSGPHLHLTIRINAKAVDPITFMNTQGATAVIGGTVTCGSVDGELSDPGSGPQSGADKLTPRARNAKLVMEARFGCAALNSLQPCVTDIGGYRASNAQTPDHPEGRAIDVMTGPGNQISTGANATMGDEIAAYAIANASALGIDNIIWKQHYWSIRDPKWDPMENRGSATANHMDHVHISFKK